MFKNKSTGFYIGLAGGAVGLVTTIIYLAYTLAVGLFAPEVFVMLLLGTICSALVIFFDFKFLPLLAAVFFSLAFAFHLNDRVRMFEEMLNQIYGMSERGAILGIVILLLVLNLISVAAAIVQCFMKNGSVSK